MQKYLKIENTNKNKGINFSLMRRMKNPSTVFQNIYS